MSKIKIGIPRALLYHRYGVLWRRFFDTLGCKVIISPETNQEIVTLGINNSIDECCLAYKIYIGHVIYLKNRCDYILVSRICNYGPNNKVCTRLNGLYDDIKYIVPKSKIISYDTDHIKNKYEFIEFIKMGFKINKNPLKILYSYLLAKKYQRNYDQEKENKIRNKINKPGSKILIIAQAYNINDKYISNYIVEYLESNNIIILQANDLNKKLASSFSEYFSETLYWKYSKELMGSIYYYRHQIDGIIFISTYPCSLEALVNNLAIYKNGYLPILNLIIDENTTNLSLETKLESYLDIVKGAKNEQ